MIMTAENPQSQKELQKKIDDHKAEINRLNAIINDSNSTAEEIQKANKAQAECERELYLLLNEPGAEPPGSQPGTKQHI